MIVTAESIARATGRGREKQTPTGFMTLCPAHDDHNPSLSVDEKGGEILVRCRVGCEQTRVIDALRDRGLWRANDNGAKNGSSPRRSGLTLAEFAAAKGFEPGFLSNAGVSEEKGARELQGLERAPPEAHRRARSVYERIWSAH